MQEGSSNNDSVGVASIPHVNNYLDYTAHPFELATVAWSATSSYATVTSDIWDYYISNIPTTLFNKIANFKFCKTKIKITVMVQGMSLSQGALILSFDPAPLDPNISSGLTTFGNYIQSPQKTRSMLLPHIKIDPSKSQRYELILECPTQWGVYPVYAQSGANAHKGFGSYAMNYIVLNGLGMATATINPTVNLMIYMSLVDPEFTALTFTSSVSSNESKPSTFMRKMGEFSTNVSKIPIPIISEGATLFSSVAGSIADALAWLGFSRHYDQITNVVTPTTTLSYTTVDGKVEGKTMALRQANSVSINPQDVPLGSFKDQDLQYLCGIPAFVYQYQIDRKSVV